MGRLGTGDGGGVRGGYRGGEGATHLFLALVIWPLTTRPYRDGAPSLPSLETLPTLWALGRFLPCISVYNNISLHFVLSVCGHLSARIATVFSLLPDVPNLSISHPSILLISSMDCTFH